MQLILDVGNSRLDGGLFDDDRCIFRFELEARAQATADDWGLRLTQLVQAQGLDAAAIAHVALCSVSPPITDALRDAARHWLGCTPFVVSAAVDTGLRYAYADPNQLGTDRIANAVAARERFPGRDLLVVDAGTATTVCAVSADGEHRGGAIVPGIGLWARALRDHTAALPLLRPSVPERASGLTTADNMLSGLYYGHLGAIRELMAQIGQEAFGSGGQAFRLGTGGAATLFAGDRVGLFDFHDPDLTLQGTRLLLRRHLSSTPRESACN